MTTQNLEMVSGDAVVLEVTILDETTDDPVDLAGCTATFKVASYWSRTAVFTKTTSDDVSVVDAAAGRLDVSFDSEDTSALEGEYLYELQIVDSAANRSTPLTGIISISCDLIETLAVGSTTCKHGSGHGHTTWPRSHCAVCARPKGGTHQRTTSTTSCPSARVVTGSMATTCSPSAMPATASRLLAMRVRSGTWAAVWMEHQPIPATRGTHIGGFEANIFETTGPFPADQNSVVWEKVGPGVLHFWRVLTLQKNGWVPSETATFNGLVCIPDNASTSSP